jgi:hypothetical protein
VADLLLQAWEDDFDKKQIKEPRPGKSRHGKAPTNGGRLKPPAEVQQPQGKQAGDQGSE